APDLFTNAAAVVVDDEAVVPFAMPGQMDLADAVGSDRVDPAHGFAGRLIRRAASVACIDEEVVDVQQQPAARAPRQLVEELGFGQRVAGPADIGADV